MPRSRLLLWLLLSASGLLGCAGHTRLYPYRAAVQHYAIADSALPKDAAMTAMLAPYKLGVDTQMKVVICSAGAPLTKAQPESSLGNLVAEATLAAARKLDPKVDFAVSNYGGIRIPYIAPGPINREKVYELMPFDNVLTIVDIPGSVIQELCNHMASRRGWPVAGIRYVIDGAEAKDIRLEKYPNDTLYPGRVYKVALPDYVAKGGDDCAMLQELRKRYTKVFIRDAILDYMTAVQARGELLKPILDQRVRYAGATN